MGLTAGPDSVVATTGTVVVSVTLKRGTTQSGISRGTPRAREMAFIAASVLWSV